MGLCYLVILKMKDFERFRSQRNNSKYYGKIPSVEDAKEIKKFHKKNKKFLLQLIKSKLE